MHMDKQIENESLSEDLLDATEKIFVVVDGTKCLMRRDHAALLFVARREWEAEKHRRGNAAYHAIERYRQRRNQHHQKAALDAIRAF